MDHQANEKIEVLKVPIFNVTMREAVKKIEDFTKGERLHTVFTPNPEIVMLANENKRLFTILKQADLVVPDGIGVVIASKLQKGMALKERVAGYDLVQKTMEEAAHKGYKFYFLGSKPGIADQAAEKMRQVHPGIQIVGSHDGYFKPEESSKVVEDINRSGANILLVAVGAPKQEIWIDDYKEDLHHVKVAIGVGGSLDVMAGAVKRAPLMYQKMGLEWFYRLIKEPTRIGRMMVLPKFLVRVLCTKS